MREASIATTLSDSVTSGRGRSQVVTVDVTGDLSIVRTSDVGTNGGVNARNQEAAAIPATTGDRSGVVVLPVISVARGSLSTIVN